MSDKLYISFDDVVDMCQTICTKIEKENDLEVCNIIGLSRGGLIPATILAQMLNVSNVYSIGLKSYAEDGSYNTRLKTPETYQHLTRTNIKNINKCEGSVLVVDDISDQGITMMHVSNKYKLKNQRCVSLFIKHTSCFIPRYYCKSTNEWIVFPWELNN